ncbi:MAG: lamin tail domain-containing protein [Chloroflexi bacterium]|nr:lamin tail domain-containing protein [Chloroflexota bacterium]
MRNIMRLFIGSVLLGLLAGCSVSSSDPPTLEPPSTYPILISEVMAGKQGNNNYEFIELYNPGVNLVDLQGWSLWYRLATSDADLPVYSWEMRTLIPPHGHYLLVRSGEDLGLPADAFFTQGLNTSGGGLTLRNASVSTADSLGWGVAPEGFLEGVATPKLQNDYSLERKPGGEAGNKSDTDNNETDFLLQSSPYPQNTGSAATPALDVPFQIELSLPVSLNPGERFPLTLTLRNNSAQSISNLNVELPIPSEFTFIESPSGVTLSEGVAAWTISEIPPSAEEITQITLEVPWTYFTTAFRSYYAHSSTDGTYAFGEPYWISVSTGSVPIGVARSLIGSVATIEGIATMYTGGYYSGGGNVKFYLEDDSGGVQIYVPTGEGALDVPIGATVQARGVMTLYRGAIELIPDTPEDVEVLALGEAPEAIPVSLQLAVHDNEDLPGRLVEVVGTASRIEEFSYSYEIDLVDDEGNLLSLYVDKLTEMTTEALEEGRLYQASGIMEIRDGRMQLNPRQQDDLVELFPPVVQISIDAPNTIHSGEIITITINASNHTSEAIEDLRIWAPHNLEGALFVDALDEGEVSADILKWIIPELPGNGGTTSVSYRVQAQAFDGTIVIDGYGAQAPSTVEILVGEPKRIFLGSYVPIWAIQGSGDRSPYKLENVTTTGAVIGVFPDMAGFWIQNTTPDQDSETSEGLFISTGELSIPVALGDRVEVGGKIREVSAQTQLEIFSADDITVSGSVTALPAAFLLDPPADKDESALYFETLEGMLVAVDEPALVVGPTTRFGESALVLAKHEISRVMRGEPNGLLIMVDDGSSEEHLDRSTLPYAVSTGDQITGLEGPLAFTYGQYKIEPNHLPGTISEPYEIGSVPSVEPPMFSMMTWNVENLFDILDPHPSSPPRPRKAKYELDLTKVANTLLAAGAPTIVGLQEVENIGIMEDLAAHELLSPFNYLPVLIEGTDSRGIDVAYLVRADRAQILDVQQFVAPEGLTSRPPLLIKVQLDMGDENRVLYVLNNHFTSLAGGEAATEPRRAAQSAWNVEIIDRLHAADPDAHVVVLGDLNSFYNSLPIDVLRESGLRHAFELLPGEERYTYIYQGVSQTLDHILVSPSIWAALEEVHVLHTNADFAMPDPDDDSPIRKSDHDPVIVIIDGLRIE